METRRPRFASGKLNAKAGSPGLFITGFPRQPHFAAALSRCFAAAGTVREHAHEERNGSQAEVVLAVAILNLLADPSMIAVVSAAPFRLYLFGENTRFGLV